MSHYKRIQTQITDRDCLVQALEAVGVPFEQGQALALQGYSGTHPQTVEFAIRKQHLRSYGDLGFHRVGNQYEVIVDDMDRRGQEVMRQVQQQYAVIKVTKEARSKGYTVVPQKVEGGVIRLQLRRY